MYLIRHNVTGKVYIGSSKDPDSRYKSHLYALKNGHHIVEDFQRDYNEDSGLSFEVLEKIASPAESYKEYEAMDLYQSRDRNRGYNYRDAHRYYRKPSEAEAKEPEPEKPRETYMPMKRLLRRSQLIGDIVCEITDPDADVAVVSMVETILRRDREFREGKI